MRALIIVVIALLAIIFVGGSVNVGSAPIFQHMDSLLRTDVLMDLHYSVFYFLYRGEDNAAAGLSRTKSDLEQFQDKPAGIDKRGYQRKVDEASR
ncbi:MAG TPA: hypothetical protein VMC85_02335 [Desulfomonilaceae bacterium]|nr:hypothetical protein [Desulfomonilaceae bacterium]